MSTHNVQIELEGVISLLARNLYSDPEVFLRELVQNAHDAIVKRRLIEPDRVGRVHVHVDRTRRELSVEDDGLGLDEDDIHRYLATIGRSGTREFKEELRTREQAVTLIGQFGIGLLSAFIVASRVEVDTRGPDGNTWRWVSGGGSTYELLPGTRDTQGSTVTLTLRAECQGWLDYARLRAALRRHCDFVPVPIHLGIEEVPVNSVVPPWDGHPPSGRPEALRHWWSRRFEQRPLELLAIDLPLRGGRLCGALGFPERESLGEEGQVDLYVAGMFITRHNRHLLPGWAKFVLGVVSCDLLTPNAARDDVMQDEVLDAVRVALVEELVGHLRRLVETRRDHILGILRLHSRSMLPLLAHDADDELFRAIADMVPLRTNRGPMTLPELREASPRSADGRVALHTHADWGAATPLKALCAARGIPVLDLSERGTWAFLDRYARVWPGAFVQLRVDLAGQHELVAPVPRDEVLRYRALLVAASEVARPLRLQAEVGCFAPASLASLVLETPAGRGERLLDEAAEDTGLPDVIAGLLDNRLDDGEDEVRGVWTLNAESPLVDRLAATPNPRGPRMDAALRLLLHQARLLAGHQLGARELEEMAEDTNRLLTLLLDEEHAG